MMPSAIISAMACRRRFWTCIGVVSIPESSTPLTMSLSTAWKMTLSGAGGERTTSAAQRLISRSSCEAAFWRRRQRRRRSGRERKRRGTHLDREIVDGAAALVGDFGPLVVPALEERNARSQRRYLALLLLELLALLLDLFVGNSLWWWT